MFRFASIATALVCLVLFVLLLISPATYLATYGVVADTGGTFMVRRAAPMFIGFTVILWLVRDAPPSPLRNAISYGIAAAFIGIAVTGFVAFVQGHATPLILVAAAGETLIGTLFLRSTR